MRKVRNKNDEMFWLSARDNALTFNKYYLRLTELAISRFEWKNLPKPNGVEVGVDERFLELILFSQGHSIFFKDEVLGYLSLQGAISGKFNVYRIPTERHAIADNGYNKHLTDKDSVIIYDNYLHTNPYVIIEQYARRLANIDRIIDINVNAQKTPVTILCSENERLTMENLFMKYDGNQPFIFGENDLNLKGVRALNTGAPYIADRLYQLKTQIWNEALTYLGISNTNTTKKERMVTDEVTRNNGGTIASRHSPLEARRQACMQINEMFPDLNIWVVYRQDYQLIDTDLPSSESEVIDYE